LSSKKVIFNSEKSDFAAPDLADCYTPVYCMKIYEAQQVPGILSNTDRCGASSYRTKAHSYSSAKSKGKYRQCTGAVTCIRSGTTSGGYNRRTQKKVKAGVTSSDTVRDRDVAGDRPRHFCVCVPVRGTDACTSLPNNQRRRNFSFFTLIWTEHCLPSAFPPDSDDDKLPGYYPAAVFESGGSSLFDGAAAGYFHSGYRYGSDIVGRQNGAEFFAVIDCIQLGTADKGYPVFHKIVMEITVGVSAAIGGNKKIGAFKIRSVDRHEFYLDWPLV
jgi:hypothetical protein